MTGPVELPELGSLWEYPPWTNEKWMGPWKVVRVGPAGPDSEVGGTCVFLERVDGPPESWSTEPKEVPIDLGWPGQWVKVGEGPAKLLPETLTIDRIWRSDEGCRSTYFARVLVEGEWKVVELPGDVALPIIAELQRELVHLRELLDSVPPDDAA